ncbi:MAG TPA: hypothetical protein VE800_05160, partial [Actinomycetota bacterium]|nr:hypothetical protein [Actinomycetota bacterium]
MRRGIYRFSKPAAVLTVTLGLLTPMAANMVGAAAGAPGTVPPDGRTSAIVSSATPRAFHAP